MKRRAGLKVIEFKAKHVLTAPDMPLSVGPAPMRHPDGRAVVAGDLIAGKVYTVRSDGLLMQNIRKGKRK